MAAKPKFNAQPGDTFGEWTVLCAPYSTGNGMHVRCRCSCGQTHERQLRSLILGRSRSCHRITRPRSLEERRLRASWRSMHSRCNCGPGNNKSWLYYGARGITVCERWKSFDNFAADMGPQPEGKTLDRIDNDRGYSPDNCRWATPQEQQANTRQVVAIEIDGERLPMKQWAKRVGVSPTTIASRLKRGFTGREAVYGRTA